MTAPSVWPSYGCREGGVERTGRLREVAGVAMDLQPNLAPGLALADALDLGCMQ